MTYNECLNELANRIENIVEKAKEVQYNSERSRRKDIIAAVKRETRNVCGSTNDNIEKRLLYNHSLAFANSLLNEMSEADFYYYISILVSEIRTQANKLTNTSTYEKSATETNTESKCEDCSKTETCSICNRNKKQETETRKISSGLIPFRN